MNFQTSLYDRFKIDNETSQGYDEQENGNKRQEKIVILCELARVAIYKLVRAAIPKDVGRKLLYAISVVVRTIGGWKTEKECSNVKSFEKVGDSNFCIVGNAEDKV